jgi:hypothetical protein
MAGGLIIGKWLLQFIENQPYTSTNLGCLFPNSNFHD